MQDPLPIATRRAGIARAAGAAVLLALLALGARSQAPADGSGSDAPRALALLIGIDEYLQPDGDPIASLRGAVRDVERVRRLLLDRFRFPADGIVTLCNEAATHEAIVRTFHDHLIRRAGPATHVVVWFSGHGSEIPDASGQDLAQADGDLAAHDQTLLTHDSRGGDRNGSYDLTDDEMHSLFAALRAHDVVYVTDCCHSGGALRGASSDGARKADGGVRPLDRDAIRPFWPDDVEFLDDGRGTVAENVVHIAACASDQEAGEFDSPDGRHGSLTWFLTDALARADERTSWRAVAATVRANIAGAGTRPDQYVHANGDRGRAIFGGRGRPIPAGYPVDRDGKRRLRVGAGRIQGVTAGTALRLVDGDGRELGKATVENAHATRSWAELDDGCDALAPHLAVWAIPSGNLGGHAALVVRLGEGIAADRLADGPWARAARADEHDEYLLQRSADQLELRLPDGTVVRRMADTTDAAQDALFHEHCFRSLWEGVAQPGTYALEVTFTPANEDECFERGSRTAAARLQPDADAASAAVRAPWLLPESGGGMAAINVVNRSDEDLFVAVLSVQEDRQVHVIVGRDPDNNFLRRGASLRQRVLVGPSREWRGDRPMIDRYVVIATPRYADFGPFESRGTLTEKRGGAASGLPRFLQRALPRAPTRGGDDGTPNWGVRWFDLRLLPPDADRAAAAAAASDGK